MTWEKALGLLLSAGTLLVAAFGNATASSHPYLPVLASIIALIVLVVLLWEPSATALKRLSEKRRVQELTRGQQQRCLEAMRSLVPLWKRYREIVVGEKNYTFRMLCMDSCLATPGEVDLLFRLLSEIDLHLTSVASDPAETDLYWLSASISGIHYFVMNRLNGRESFFDTYMTLNGSMPRDKFRAKRQDWALFITEYNGAAEPIRNRFARVFGAKESDLFHLLTLEFEEPRTVDMARSKTMEALNAAQLPPGKG